MQLKGLHSLSLPIMNLWTWTYTLLFGISCAFQQLFVSAADSHTLEYGWVSGWIKIQRIEFHFFSLPGCIFSLYELSVEKEFQTVQDCLLAHEELLNRSICFEFIVIAVHYLRMSYSKHPRPGEIVVLYTLLTCRQYKCIFSGFPPLRSSCGCGVL